MLLKKIENRYLGFINIYEPFFCFAKLLVFSCHLVKIDFKIQLFIIIIIAFKKYLKFANQKKWFIDINKTYISICQNFKHTLRFFVLYGFFIFLGNLSCWNLNFQNICCGITKLTLINEGNKQQSFFKALVAVLIIYEILSKPLR